MIEQNVASSISLDDGIVLDSQDVNLDEDNIDDDVILTGDANKLATNEIPSLDDGVVLNDNDIIDTVSSSDVQEDHEVKEQLEKNIPASQDTLYSRYIEKYPDIFQDGKLVDYDAAKEIGIITEVSPVPGSDETVIGGHVSTKSEDAPFGFTYNTESNAVQVQQSNAKEAEDFRRIDKVEETFDIPEMTEAEELKNVNEIISSMPNLNPNGSINLTKKFFELTGPTGFNFMMGMGKTFSYVGAGYTDAIEKIVKETQETFPEQYEELIGKEPKYLANELARATGAGFEFSESIPILGQTQGLFFKLPKASERIANKLITKAAKNKKAAEKAWNRRLNVSKMKSATAEQIKEKQDAAKKVANENKDVANQLIKEFEDKTKKTISKTDSSGNKTLDYSLAREVGNETSENLIQGKGKSLADKVKEEITGEASISDGAKLFGQGDTLFQPILKPEKFDGIVAVASDLKKSNPEAFNNNKTIIDNLFDLTVNKKLIAGDKLIDSLNKYDISFEDYVLTVVGSGSTAGQVLNKLSQIKRARPVNEMVAMQQAATIKNQDTFRNTVMRIENIRRGGLVSQIATAARNLTSAGIRAPLESLGNVLDTAMYEIGKGNIIKGTTSLSPIALKLPTRDALSPVKFSNNWKDSFRHMKYMFDNPKETKEIVDFILERPELTGQFDLLFNNINEILLATGRGSGGPLDNILTAGEDAVMALNTPNRWQEFLVRRGAFLGELERLTKREYGIDLIDTLSDGKIRDLLNDAGNVRPQGARSFIDIVSDATNKALDITYAKQPEVPMFRSIASFIVRNGLTVVAPFPRFMFNSMELMGQYGGGASIPLTKMISNVVTRGKAFKGGVFTAKDRQRVSRNLIGVATMYGAYQYRTSEDAPPDFKKLRVGEDTEMDTTPQYPLKQFLYLGELGKRIVDGTIEDFFDSKDFLETFVGTNLRTGVGESIFQDIADIVAATDISTEEKKAKALAKPIAQYLSSWFVPFAQLIEAQRAIGVRGLEYKDMRQDPTLDVETTFAKELKTPFKQRGFFVSPEEEEQAPKREFVFSEDKSRVGPVYRVLFGLNLSNRDSVEGEYLTNLGYKEYKFGSRSQVPTVQRAENKIIKEVLPEIVRVARFIREPTVRNEYRSSGQVTKGEFTEQSYVNSDIKAFINEQVRVLKAKIASEGLGKGQASNYARLLLDFRKLPKSIRRRAVTDFYTRFDPEPDVTAEKDLARLKKIGDTYKKAFSGR